MAISSQASQAQAEKREVHAPWKTEYEGLLRGNYGAPVAAWSFGWPTGLLPIIAKLVFSAKI